MIMFDCPKCKTKLRVGEEHVGKTIQCPKCNEKTVVRAEDAASAGASAPEPRKSSAAGATPEQAKASKRTREEGDVDDAAGAEDDRPRRRGRRRSGDDADTGTKVAKGLGTGAVVAIVLGVSFCCLLTGGSVLLALLVPAFAKVREAATRTQSMNNLKQIALAMHSFNDTNRRFPFNGTRAAAPGDPASGSWAFQILPYMDQIQVYQAVDRTRAVKEYMDPARGRPMVETSNGGGAWTDYFYNNYLNDQTKASDPKAPDFKRTMAGIPDGTSNTILVGQGNINIDQYPLSGNVNLSTNIFMGGTPGTMRAGNNTKKGAGNPTGVTLARDSNTNPTIGSWGGPFPQGALMAMCDGSVHMFPYTTGNFGAFLTPDGAEMVVPP